MTFDYLSKFLNSAKKLYNIQNYRISVYHNNINVFYAKKGYTFFENANKKQICVNPKIMYILGFILLAEENQISLNEKISEYLIDSSDNITIKDMLRKYLNASSPNDDMVYVNTITKVLEQLSKYTIEEYIDTSIIKPLKLKKTTLKYMPIIQSEAQCLYTNTTNIVYLHTTIDDYSRFCNIICKKNISLKYKSLKLCVEILSDDILKLNDTNFSYIGYNGEFIFIDSKNDVVIVYSQISNTLIDNQKEICFEIQNIVSQCTSNNTWPIGCNLFP